MVDGLLAEIDGGRISSTGCIPTPPPGAVGLAGLTVPGFANCHSHAFHRALRGRPQRGRGTFWTWRDQMYSVAARREPDNYYALARATYEEMHWPASPQWESSTTCTISPRERGMPTRTRWGRRSLRLPARHVLRLGGVRLAARRGSAGSVTEMRTRGPRD